MSTRIITTVTVTATTAAEAADSDWGRLGTISTFCGVAMGTVGVAVTLRTWLHQRRRRRPAVDEEAGGPIPLATVEGGTHVYWKRPIEHILPTPYYPYQHPHFQREGDDALDTRASIEVGWSKGQSLDDLQFKIIPFPELLPTASRKLRNQDEYLFDAKRDATAPYRWPSPEFLNLYQHLLCNRHALIAPTETSSP
ncbi:hypothetical protein DL767_000937 [Monosporascus sp. MG133]|nr:hypothetical protein DL767_000937 [Monosporascus sp. MG133]